MARAKNIIAASFMLVMVALAFPINSHAYTMFENYSSWKGANPDGTLTFSEYSSIYANGIGEGRSNSPITYNGYSSFNMAHQEATRQANHDNVMALGVGILVVFAFLTGINSKR
jgi:hypothetical protein